MGRLRFAAGALPLILILAACSSGATPSPSSAGPSAAASPPAAASPSAAPSSGASPSEAASETYDLKVAAGAGSITNYLTGEAGKTLYIFTKDTKDSGKSVCNGDCATNWPPFVVSSLDEVKPDNGVTGKLALVTRDDGTTQVSYNGQPLYQFAADKAAGDTNGQGVGGIWFVANP